MKQIVAVLALAAGFALAQVEVVRHAGGVDDYGAFVIGEVDNKTDQPVEYVEVIASFYDAGGAFIDSTFAYTELDTIAPHGESPFTLGTSDVQEFDTYELQVEASTADEGPHDAFSTSGVRMTEDDFGWTIVGQVTNESDQAMEFVQVVASAYVGARLVGTSFAYTELDTLQPGQTSPFRVGFSTMLDQPSDYRVWVEGSPVD